VAFFLCPCDTVHSVARCLEAVHFFPGRDIHDVDVLRGR
jgi:hypothetical protein